MKNIFRSLFLVALLSSVTSCEDFLSPDPLSNLVESNFYQTDDQITAALTSLYAPLRSAQFGSTYTLDWSGFSDEDTHYNWSENRVRDFSTYNTNAQALAFWTAAYSTLKDVAYLLDGLERNQELISETVYQNAMGEAHFFRAYYHFMLTQWYCAVDTGIPFLMEIIRSYEDASMPLTNLEDAYIQIISDLEEAEEWLTLSGQTWTSLGYSERVTVSAVRGILARACLYAAGYPNNGGALGKFSYEDETGMSATGSTAYYMMARDAAERIIETGEHSLEENYCDVFIAQAQDSYVTENIWEVGYQYTGSAGSETNTGGAVGQQFGLSRSYSDEDTGVSVNDSLLSNAYRYCNPRLFASYGIGDDRRDWNCPNFIYESQTLLKLPLTLTWGNYTSSNFTSAGMGGAIDAVIDEDGINGYGVVANQSRFERTPGQIWTACTGKWRREYEDRITRDGNNTTTNYPLLRYSDVLLMAAEAYIMLKEELGQTGKAAEYIDKVRARSVKNPVGTGMVSQIVIDNSDTNNRAYGAYLEVPDIEIEHNGGSGFTILANPALRTQNYYGLLNIGVQSRGTGYSTTNPPIARITSDRVVTWKANTSYPSGSVVSSYISEAAGTFRIYRASTGGTSTDVNPTHSSGTGDIEVQGVTWTHMAGLYYLNQPKPKLAVVVEGSVSPTLLGMGVNVTDPDAMFEALKDERRRELCFESLRRQDLKRWGILYETMLDVVNDADGTTSYNYGPGTNLFYIPPYSTNPVTHLGSVASTITKDKSTYLPIPNSQLLLNKNLIQNPGY